MDFSVEENPENLIIPLELSKVIYQSWNADLIILDKPDQVYGKALHGNGSVSFKNGNLYEGDLHNGMMHGQGKFTWKNGVVYEGEFRYNAIEGHGKYQWTDGSHYEGEVKASLRDGVGTFIAPNDEAKYTGEWKDGLRHGKGRIEFAGGAVYEGDFFNGYKHGTGKMTYPSGNFYEGSWRYDKKEGQGTMNWLSSNEKYYGNWKENQQNGFGVHIWLEGKGEGKLLRNRYEGQWVEGQRHGFGIFYYANGSKYEGEWKNNLKEGYAIFTEDNGNVIQGLFKADRLIKEKTVPKGQQAAGNNAAGDGVGATAGQQQQGKNAGGNRKDTAAGNNASSKKSAINSGVAKSSGQNVQSSSPTAAQVQQLPSAAQASASSQQQQQQNAAAAAAAAQKKKEIEQNPFTYLVDFSDLLGLLENEQVQDQVLANIQNMLLRHNSSMKQWYKHFSVKYENGIGEDAFAMDLQTFWKFLQEARVLDSSVTLAAVDRIFLQGAKNRFVMKTDEGEVDRQIETLKKLGRPLTLQELQDLDYLTLTSQQTGQKSSQIDWQKLQQETDGNIFAQRKQTVVHEPNRIILYRHFVELIVRTAYLKSPYQLSELHRAVEKLIDTKLVPLFEKQKSGEKAVLRPKSSISDKSTLHDKRDWASEYAAQLKQMYEAIAVDNKNPAFGVVDRTLRFKDFLRFLEKIGKLDPASHDKQIAQNLIEHYFDTDSTLAHLEQLQKEEQAKEKKKVTKKEQKKAQAPPQPTVDYERLKIDRFAKLLETELLYPEFEHIMIAYLFKREKDLHSNKEAEVEKKLREHFDKIIQNAGGLLANTQTQQKNIVHKPKRVWPRSEKDQKKQDLAALRLKQREEAEEKRRKDDERKREARERVLMKLEDNNIPSEPEDDGYDDD